MYEQLFGTMGGSRSKEELAEEIVKAGPLVVAATYPFPSASSLGIFYEAFIGNAKGERAMLGELHKMFGGGGGGGSTSGTNDGASDKKKVPELTELTVPELKEFAEEMGIKKDGVGWKVCCPPEATRNDIIRAILEHSQRGGGGGGGSGGDTCTKPIVKKQKTSPAPTLK